jgi:CubicO group peptidase (beta-lactamase class C family)
MKKRFVKKRLAGVNRLAGLLVVVLLAISTCAAQTASSVALAARVDEYLNDLVKQNRFSGSILIARDGRVLMTKGYGMANYETDAPNTPQTKFRLGSITKQFTALAVMMMQERGKLNVQDSVCKYVSECPAAWQPVQIHHLLTHTSGIWNFTGTPDYRKTMSLPSSPAETIARFKDKPLEFTPGERFNYSNSGYVLLGYIVEKISGQTYEAFLRENIFEPLKMMNTGYDNPNTLLKNRASGYSMRSGTLTNALYIDMTIPFAAGALYSTVEDLYLWDQALYTDKLVKQKTLDAAFTPFKANYGYGFTIDKRFGLKHLTHGGAINGFTTFISRFPDEKATVIVLNNIDTVASGQIASRLARLALSDRIVVPAVAKLEPSILQSYAGRYQMPPSVAENFVFDVTVVNGGLSVKPSGMFRAEFAPASQVEFFDVDQPENRLTFQKDEKGNVYGMLVTGIGPEAATARKLQLPAPSLSGNTMFRLAGYPQAKVVALAGTFNNWNQSATLCGRELDAWVCRIDLAPGRYTYKFVVDGNWITDPANAQTEDDGRGNTNSVLVKAK